MLIIERKNGQTVDVERDGVVLATIRVQIRRDGGAVRLLFEAPPDVRIFRPEYRAQLAGRLASPTPDGEADEPDPCESISSASSSGRMVLVACPSVSPRRCGQRPRSSSQLDDVAIEPV